MSKLYSSIACNLDAAILQAALPLFEAEKVEAIEWSFDALFKHHQLPDWFIDLLTTFGNANRLIGHGVFFSLFSGKWTSDQQAWLAQLRKLTSDFTFDHITEHFGFMTGDDFHKGAPISIPFTASTLALGRDRLQRIQQVCNCPVGLENLAFAYSLDDVKRHGDFLNQLIEPINGFIILDLHNLYCQVQNFDVDASALLMAYPLDRVREIHISGGSWEPSSHKPEQRIRRDTHDDAVPMDVFSLLNRTLPNCPNLKFVVMEQLGIGLQTAESQYQFRQDFLTMDEMVQAANQVSAPVSQTSFLPVETLNPSLFPAEDLLLHSQQTELSTILETAVDYRHARRLLDESTLAHSDWNIEEWDPYMLETALAIAQKWKNGFV
jgi:uncharacterized protein (UPF0276 family)